MGYDINKLQSSWAGGNYLTPEHRKVTSKFGDQDGEFAFLSFRDLPDHCEVVFRFLPPAPDKLPDGFLETAVHTLDPNPMQPERKYRVACLRPKQCYICDLLEASVPLRAAHKLEPKATEALGKTECRRQMLFVVSIFATCTITADANGKKTYRWGGPFDSREAEHEHGAILQVFKPDVNDMEKSSQTVLGQLLSFLCPKPSPLNPNPPDVSSYSSGLYLKLTKSRNKYLITPASQPCEMINKELLTKYPDVKKRLGTIQQATYGEQETAVAGCWWADVPQIRSLREAMHQGGQVYSEGAGLGPAFPAISPFEPGPATMVPPNMIAAAPAQAPMAPPTLDLPFGPPPGSTGPVVGNPFDFATPANELPWN